MSRPADRTVAVAVCCCLAAGCTLGGAFRQPDAPLPAAWRDPPPAQASANPWPAADWWHGFGSAPLDRLIEAARQHNDDLAAAVARVEEADAQARIAGAPLLPSLDLDATAARQQTSFAGSRPVLYDTFSPTLVASYELDFWGKNRATRDSARAAAAASRFDRETVALTVVGGVASTYFQALALRDRIEVAKRNLANGEKVLAGLALEQRVGTATALDVAQQETVVAELRAALPPLEQQLRQALDALAVLVGCAPEALDIDSGSLADLATPRPAAGLPSELLARRPDVAAAEAQLAAAHADIAVARAALFPSIALTASGGYASDALATLVAPDARIYAVSAGLVQPIFRGGALRAEVGYRRARYQELLAGYHKTVLIALQNTEDALVAVSRTEEQLARQREAVEKARRAYEYSQAQLAAGTVNVLTVLNTENTLFGAEDSLVQVQYAHLQSLVNLFTALGGGWQRG